MSKLSAFPYTSQCNNNNNLETVKCPKVNNKYCMSKKKRIYILTLPLFLDHIHDGHVLTYVGYHLHLSAGGYLSNSFFFLPI